MTKKLSVAMFVFIAITAAFSASQNEDQSKQYQQATVLSVNKKLVKSPNTCCERDATDAPLQTTYYGYDIFVRVDCTEYVAHLDREADDLPVIFKADASIPVRVTKDALYVEVPGESELKINIVHRDAKGGAACNDGSENTAENAENIEP